VDVTIAQGAAFQMTKLIEDEQRVIAVAPEMPIPCGTFLISMRWTDRAIHIQSDVVQSLALMHRVNPLTGHVCQCVPIGGSRENFSLEAAHL
jgi:hypothetical protein